MGNAVGYARVSTVDQNLGSQLDALKKAGAARILTDKLSGSTTARPQLQACLAYLNPSVCWRCAPPIDSAARWGI